MTYWTQEAVKAETDYRLELARAGALRREARKARPSRMRKLFTRSTPTTPTPRPVHRATPALP